MKRIISIISLTIAVLIFFTACGIPRLFRWDYNTQYTRTNSSIRFDAHPEGDNEATFADNYPRLMFYYAIGFTNSISSSSSLASASAATHGGGITGNSLAYNFNYLYDDRVPGNGGTIGYRDNYVASSTVRIDNPSTSNSLSSVRMFGFVDANTGERPRFPNGIENFCATSSNPWLSYNDYDYAITFSAEPVPYEDGYAILLTLYPESEAPEEYQIEYLLLRNNRLPFHNRLSDYIGTDQGAECEYSEDDPASSYESGDSGSPAIFIFASCSYGFTRYNTRQTGYIDLVGNPILLTELNL